MPSARSAEFLVRTVTGLERLTAAELTEAGHRVVDVTKRQLIVEAAGPVETRLADDLFTIQASVPDPGRTRAALGRAVAELTRHLAPEPRLSVTASFTGARNFSRYDIEDAVGARLGVAYFSRRHGTPPPPGTTDVGVTLDGKVMWLVVRPHAPPPCTAAPGGGPPWSAACTRRSPPRWPAWPTSGRVTWSSIPLLRGRRRCSSKPGRWKPGASYHGRDIDPKAVEAARLNDPAIDWRTEERNPERILANPPWGVRLPATARFLAGLAGGGAAGRRPGRGPASRPQVEHGGGASADRRREAPAYRRRLDEASERLAYTRPGG